MFKIEHKCNESDPALTPYSIQIGQRAFGSVMMPLSRVICPKCREEFYVLGHEMFSGAEARGPSGMPQGFVIARSGLNRA